MGFNLFVATRIYNSKSGEDSFSRPAIIIATYGIAIGIIVMLISVAVVFGFKKEISDKVVGFGSHIQILSLTMDENHQVLPVTTDYELVNIIKKVPHISHYQTFASKVGLIKTDEDFRAVQIKGVGEDYDMSFFGNYMVQGDIPPFSSSNSTNKLMISKKIASEMMLNVGTKAFVYFIDEINGNIRARKFEIAGIYETHLDEFDKQTCFTDIYTIRKLNGWNHDESTGLEIMTDDMSKLNECIDYLNEGQKIKSDSRGYERGAYTIRDLSPHIFAWLDVLDMNVVMILVLMLAIGGFTVMAGLLIVMLDRIKMIGILKSLGASNLSIRKIFSSFAVMLVGKGIIIGDIIGIGLCLIQKYFGVISLNPSTYYIDKVPVDLYWWYFLLINVGVLFISSLIIFGSSFLMSIKKPASTMRWE